MTHSTQGANALVCTSLAFQNVAFQVIDRNGQPWLRANQIGLALAYRNPELSIAKLYRARAEEFTDSMTAAVTLPTAGGEQQVRIFSLRGAHLLGMLARTSKAAAFRRWVLYLLERELESSDSRSVRINGTRWLIYFGHYGQQHVRSVNQDAVVIAPDEPVRLVAEPGVVAVRFLPEIIASAASRLQEIERVRHSDRCVPSRTGGAA